MRGSCNRHQQALCAFLVALAPHVRERRLGRVLLSPLDVIFDLDRALILQPDLVFISHARWQIRREKVIGAPDIVLEVLSPHPRIGTLPERIDCDRAATIEVDGVPIRVASLADVIRSKKAARRPRDLAVLEILERALAETTAEKGKAGGRRTRK